MIPGLGRSPGGGHGNPLQYPCLENPMDRGAWWATVHGVAQSQTQLSDRTAANGVTTLVQPGLEPWQSGSQQVLLTTPQGRPAPLLGRPPACSDLPGPVMSLGVLRLRNTLAQILAPKPLHTGSSTLTGHCPPNTSQG